MERPEDAVEPNGRSLVFDRFQGIALRIAFGSACELEHHLIVATDNGYLTIGKTRDLGSRVLRIKRMLSGLLRSVRESGLPTTGNR